MKQVVQSARTGKLELREVPEPQVRKGHLLVRTLASLISAGTERRMVQFGEKGLVGKARERPDLVKKVFAKVKRDGMVATTRAVLARLDEPLPYGYSAAGQVVGVGAGLEGRFTVGQRVAIAGAGLASHADLNLVPENLAAPVPDDVGNDEACFSTVAAIAMHGVRLTGPALGDVVAVVGVGLVGQLVVQLLALSGARVIALDYNPAMLELARRSGAEVAINLADGSPADTIFELTSGVGCDAVIVAAATDSSAPLETAAAVARDRARVCLIGMTGTNFPYRAYMAKELSIVVSRSYGPGRYDSEYEMRGAKYPVGFVRWTETANLAECARLMSPGLPRRLDVASLITHRFDFAEAEKAYALILERSEPHLGVILRYPEEAQAPVVTKITPPSITSRPAGTGRCVLGAIGGGNFARLMILPALKSMKACELHTIVTQRGISAEFSQRSFGFAHAATDVDAVLSNPEINAVVVTTPHSSHAELTARALEAGKSVLVEKPLALDREELNRVIEARNNAGGFFQVGFNRRFAPLIVKARDHLKRYQARKVLLLRVNAGQLPEESWQNNPEEGNGRILGEACHFIDLASHLVGSRIVAVQADAADAARGVCEDLTITLHFEDGSLATIVYTALGDTAFSKELFECYVGGTVLQIDNFRKMSLSIDGKVTETKARLDQDKGHKAQLAAFVQAVATGGPAPVDEDALIQSSLATIAVLEALRKGTRIEI